MMRDQAPRSISTTGENILKPEKMEIWVFEDAADLFDDQSEIIDSSIESFNNESQYDVNQKQLSSSS